ncbi:MAG: hypothetical protein OER93_03635 [Thermoleophilia bacterium]|nr:hypothetical protein [Thermoleophilia bacterium]
MSDEAEHQQAPEPDRAGPWLLVFLIAAAAVLVTWVLLSLVTGGSSEEPAGLTPAVPPEQTEATATPSASPQTRPVTPPVTGPATTTPSEPALVDRYPLGQRQGHDPANDDRRAAFGEVGAHCFVGEQCGEVPAGAEAVNEAAGGTAGIGSGLSGFGSGSGVSLSGGGGSADTAARRNAQRVPQGQIGVHCFVGEDCPPIPDDSAGGTRPRSQALRGPVVPCGELGVHSRVGESQPCVNRVISRVGTRAETLPTGTTIGLEGRCYMVVGRTTNSATVVAVPCPAMTMKTVTEG